MLEPRPVADDPITISLESPDPATAELYPITTLLAPVVRLFVPVVAALDPIVTLYVPVVIPLPAFAPIAVLSLLVALSKEAYPIAVLLLDV